MTKDDIIAFLYEHQEGALTNYDHEAREECRCGRQGDQDWRPHFADELLTRLVADHRKGQP